MYVGARRNQLVSLLAAIGCAILLSPGSSGAGTAETRYYLSLGDSLANGTQPDRHGVDRPTSHGYVDVVGAYVKHFNPALQLVKLGGAGTSRRLISGAPVDASYGPGSQLEQAVDFLQAHGPQTALITVNVGDNDVENCVRMHHIRWGCVSSSLTEVDRNLRRIGARLRAVTNDQVPVVGVADYDQFWALWFDGPRGRRIARRSAGIVHRLNGYMDQAWAATGALVADAEHPFHTLDTSRVRARGLGVVPRAVKRVCAWTWACSSGPIGFDAHANARGYQMIAGAVIRSLDSAFGATRSRSWRPFQGRARRSPPIHATAHPAPLARFAPLK